MDETAKAVSDIEIDDDDADGPDNVVNGDALSVSGEVESAAESVTQYTSMHLTGNAEFAVPADALAGGDLGIVKRILDMRKSDDGIVEFLVDWEGVDVNGEPFEPSWEPKENVYCPAEIAQFEKEWKEKQGQTKRKSTKKSSKQVHEILDSDEEQPQTKPRSSRKRAAAEVADASPQKRQKTGPNPDHRAQLKMKHPGLPVRRIFGANKQDEQWVHLVEWELPDGNLDQSWEFATNTKAYCPLKVIEYYESRLRLEPPPPPTAPDSRESAYSGKHRK